MYTNYWDYVTRSWGEYPNDGLLSTNRTVVNENRWKLLEPPVGQAVTTADAKLWSKINNTVENSLMDSLVKVATSMAERYMSRAILRQKWSMFFDFVPANNEFEIKPVGNFTIDKINSYDMNNVASVWASSNYIVDALDDINPARILLNIGGVFPSALRAKACFEVLFYVGWADANSVPDDIKTAIKMIAQNLYETREGQMNELEGADHGSGGIPDMAMRILSQYKVYNI